MHSYIWQIPFAYKCLLFLTHNLSAFSSEMIPEPWGYGDMVARLRVEHSTVYYSVHFDQLCIFVSVDTYYKRKIPLRPLRNALIYGYKDNSLGGRLILCVLSRILMLGSLLTSKSEHTIKNWSTGIQQSAWHQDPDEELIMLINSVHYWQCYRSYSVLPLANKEESSLILMQKIF